MQRADIEAAFNSAGLARRLPEIERLAQNSVRLFTRPVREARMRLGVLKIGGHPDLPPNLTWPTFKGRPQSFLVQIPLAAVYAYADSNLLPAQGMLWFF